MINIEWFHRNDRLFIDFAQIVQKKPDDLYDTEFIKYTLDQNWYQIRCNILKFRVIPHLLLCIMGNWLMFAALKFNSIEDAFSYHPMKVNSLCYICFALLAYTLALELKEMINHRSIPGSYFNLWNVIDLMALVCTFFVNVHIYFKMHYIDIDALRVVAAVGSWSLLFKIYDWLRLYSATAFFAELLFRSIKDIKFFIGLLMVSLWTFGVPMLLISMNWSDESD